MSMGRKGVAIVWINILMAIAVVAIVYIIFSWVIYGSAGIANAIPLSQINNTGALTTLNYISIVWQYWPWVFIVGLILYGLVASQRREPDSYYY